MARSKEEIFDDMIEDKESGASLLELQPEPDSAQTLQADLTSTSKVAIWRLIYFTIAAAIAFHETIFDRHKADVEAIADALITGTVRWYQEEAFKFQLGDDLVFIINETTGNGKFQYLVEDEDKQIIERASVSESGRQVVIKVAKLVADVPAPLDTSELAAFNAYVVEIRFAGTNTLVISAPPDDLQLDLRVFYDPLVLDANGESLETPGVFPAEDAIDDYIGNLPFDGVYSNTDLVDAVQEADGVSDPRLDEARARFGANPFTIIIDTYIPNAGYLKRDVPGSNITYIAAE